MKPQCSSPTSQNALLPNSMIKLTGCLLISSSDNIATDVNIMNSELERTWKEAVATYFKVATGLSQCLPGRTESLSRDSWVSGSRLEPATSRVRSSSRSRHSVCPQEHGMACKGVHTAFPLVTLCLSSLLQSDPFNSDQFQPP
jgi:hypothetical protein